MKKRKLRKWVKVVIGMVIVIVALKGCQAINEKFEKENKEAFEYCTQEKELSENYCNNIIYGN